ncbi:MAG TPA: hypothetical protein VFT42_06395 [Solirubrobacteraceae bacterium]|nr:hypothetical protein [Solirubrobacteraceae bacterium]
MARVLVLSAPIGASHTAMARALERDLRDRGASVEVLDDFAVLGPRLNDVLSRGFDYHLDRVGWSYDLAYRIVMNVGAARRAGEAALEALAGAPMLRAIRARDPDVVVSTYPIMSAILGRLRARRRLEVPVCGVVGPLAGLGFWTHPGIDLHLAMYEQALAEIERRAGPGRAVAIRPLIDRRYFEPRDPARARGSLGLDGGHVVLVNGGGWGAGDLEGGTEAALRAGAHHVLVVCGRNEQARARLSGRFDREGRVRPLGYTDGMDDLLAASDAVVSATAGVSTFEARLRACRVICSGWLIGHVRDNARALAAHGLADLATSGGALRGAVASALSRRRPPVPPLASLPSGAEKALHVAEAH